MIVSDHSWSTENQWSSSVKTKKKTWTKFKECFLENSDSRTSITMINCKLQ